MTLQDVLVAYRTYARAEGKSPKMVDWVVSSVGYFEVTCQCHEEELLISQYFLN